MREQFLQTIESEPEIDNRYKNIVRIDPQGGNGYFSLLFKADDSTTENKIALKFFDPQKSGDAHRVARFKREGEILYRLKNKDYVINSLSKGVNVFQKQLTDKATGLSFPIPLSYIPMELATSSLEDFLYDVNNTPSPIKKLKCFKELVKAVFQLHRENFCHRDLKPSNFLICNKQIKLSDLGTAKCMNGTMPDILTTYINPVGDRRYFAPELILSIGIADELVYKSDIFALGAILFEMFTYTVLTGEIYTRHDINNFIKSSSMLSGMSATNKMETFKGLIGPLTERMQLPNIYDYNNSVPKSIKFTLNKLYKNLAHLSPFNRLESHNSIHRNIDICILTLENEIKYKQWLIEKKKRRQNREIKYLIRLEKMSC